MTPHEIRTLERPVERFRPTLYGITGLLPLPGFARLCYNGAAVEYGLKRGVKPISAAGAVEKQISERRVVQELRDVSSSAGAVPAGMSSQTPGYEDASRFCPVCSQRLQSRRCKLICNVCGYYMSCADYY